MQWQPAIENCDCKQLDSVKGKCNAFIFITEKIAPTERSHYTRNGSRWASVK